jgi:hypothetical protein
VRGQSGDGRAKIFGTDKTKRKKVIELSREDPMIPWRERGGAYGSHCVDLRFLVMGRMTGRKLKNGDTKTPHVRRCGDGHTFNHLRRHPIGTPHNGHSLILLQNGAASKIGQFALSFARQQKIAAFDVAMDKVEGVEVRQSGR